jgi:transcriptional regulator GlxA family with amidase domain
MPPPTKYAVVLYPGFQALDVFGPLDALNFLSKVRPLELSIIAQTLDPVSTRLEGSDLTIGQSVVPTHTFDNAPDDIEVLLVPGGIGARKLELTQPVVDFVKRTYPGLKFLLTVCTGSALTARAGVMDGKQATSNKRGFDWVSVHPGLLSLLLHSLKFRQVTTQGPKVRWVRQARWVTDGNVWTSSGVSAGMDMIYAFASAQYGEDVANDLAQSGEYVRNTNSADDQFAALYT